MYPMLNNVAVIIHINAVETINFKAVEILQRVQKRSLHMKFIKRAFGVYNRFNMK